MLKRLQIICEHCGQSHFIRSPRSIRNMASQAIDFDICPFCATPRNMHLFVKYWKKDRCWFCGIPLSALQESEKGKFGLCSNHYELLYRHVKHAEELRKEISPL